MLAKVALVVSGRFASQARLAGRTIVSGNPFRRKVRNSTDAISAALVSTQVITGIDSKGLTVHRANTPLLKTKNLQTCVETNARQIALRLPRRLLFNKMQKVEAHSRQAVRPKQAERLTTLLKLTKSLTTGETNSYTTQKCQQR
ncbi:MAG: hypothetical protein HOP19_08810 [Acidobacteria bacterium]|nr:hypothetical protein [Acidobacteriota bacterium]